MSAIPLEALAQEQAQNSAQEDKASVVVRAGTDSDWPILCSAFAEVFCPKKIRENSTAPQRLSHYGFRVPPHILVSKLEAFRNHPDWKFLVACPKDIPDENLGMILYRPGNHWRWHAVAWLTVKPGYTRQKGIAKALLKVAGIPKGNIDCPFIMTDTAKMAQTKGYNLRFRPYMPDVALWEMIEQSNNK